MNTISKKIRFSILLVLIAIVSCDFRPKDEHWQLSFENSSDETIFVVDEYPSDNPEEYSQCGIPDPIRWYQVDPGTINYEVMPLRQYVPLSFKETYESIFRDIEYYRVYVLPKDYDVTMRHNDAKLVRYDLVLDDLLRLNMQLHYPPTEEMRGIKMEPDYFATEE